jgi:flagellar biogenesis protein FliO
VTKGNEPKGENPLKGEGQTLKEAERMMVQSASSPKILQRSSDEDKVTVPAAMPSTSVPATNHEVLAVGTSKAENGLSLIFAVTLLAGLGIAAFLLARRRASHGRMIHILETASIGAKRSLVVANVSGRTMVLAVSEAGVTLLDSTCTPVTATAQAESSESDANFVADELPVGRLTALCEKLSLAFKSKKNMSDEERLASDGESIEPEERTEGGMLGRLFSRRQSEQVEPEPTFQDVLDDSFEDQQLRQKLAAGMGGRVA